MTRGSVNMMVRTAMQHITSSVRRGFCAVNKDENRVFGALDRLFKRVCVGWVVPHFGRDRADGIFPVLVRYVHPPNADCAVCLSCHF